MPELSPLGRLRVAEVATRHGVSPAAAEALTAALAAAGGTQAQFSIPELGGMGQWSRGGMVMVGDMFNHGLKARVDALCNDLAGLATTDGIFLAGAPGGASGWWPAEFGIPASSGAQNDMRYAWFPQARRLVVARGADVTIYDTGSHVLGGVSQQQSTGRSLTFTGQDGPVRPEDFPVVSETRPVDVVSGTRPVAAVPETPPSALTAAASPAAAPAASPAVAAAAPAGAFGDILGTIERLAELHGRGILTDDEFAAKKADLLARL